jgi:putative spermidine/putrescine transport system substrate-binding protein
MPKQIIGKDRGGVSRRRFLKGASTAAGLAAGSGAIGGFPTIWAQNIKDVTINHAGPPVTAIPRIAEQASKDLGFMVHMQASENADLLNRFLSQSNAIDVADVSLPYLRYITGRKILQAIPIRKVKYWDQTIPLFTKSEYPDGRKASTQGIAPYGVLYATGPDGQKFADGPSDWVTAIPSVTNADTLYYRRCYFWWSASSTMTARDSIRPSFSTTTARCSPRRRPSGSMSVR